MLYYLIQEYCLKRLVTLREKQVFVFGAGKGGSETIKVLNKLDVKTVNILDNDPNKWDELIENVKVTSPDILMQYDPSCCLVLVSLTDTKQVAKQLETYGFQTKNYELVLADIDAHLKMQFEYIQNNYFISHCQDINMQLYKISLEETANFVLENMMDVRQFEDKYELLKESLNCVSLSGSFLEFGVFQGVSINFISSLKTQEQIIGFDSFEGLPETWMPGFEKGTFALSNLPVVNENVKLVKGWFNDTLPLFKGDDVRRCAFIHIDCDLYSSTKVIFKELGDRIVSGTVIQFDEFFNFPNWKNGEYKAFIEFIEESGKSFEFIGYVSKGQQVSVKIL
ncbi:TylF/MycF/NovP-related O-methyltransferase [Ammoniphilus sp. CFH 90114]|uniref:TylF/MycF/NovP-related O-methyltransferase n=1 Tax=Ammoniphilus sp. CFH 90114 TaxID=2493665 RepID=UPI00100E5B84|nr:TylF/MycF/NovP-related O-methyltransferase [Ammoniphilus sp. CFH 90114]RXT04467.1 hypothetical protein EIZ39_19795 [Ammoniphilus sp. CFH 90114]